MSQLLAICLSEKPISWWSLTTSLILRMDNLLLAIHTSLSFSQERNGYGFDYPASLTLVRGWPVCFGMTGRIGSEWVADLRRNTQIQHWFWATAVGSRYS